MQFDSNNNVIKLCAKGMEMEANQKPAEAQLLFLEAWDKATNDFEKFTAAHYVARHQDRTEDKLKWDKIALASALKIDDNNILASYPSLYLNIAKCYEDLKQMDDAKEYYKTALSYANHLPDNGYGQMIKSGIEKGIERTSEL